MVKPVVKGKTYQLCHQPPDGYFFKKYGTAEPLITIECRDIELWGKPWLEMAGNPAALQFGMRSVVEQPIPLALKDEVYYGKVTGLGELVFLDELQEVRK